MGHPPVGMGSIFLGPILMNPEILLVGSFASGLTFLCVLIWCMWVTHANLYRTANCNYSQSNIVDTFLLYLVMKSWCFIILFYYKHSTCVFVLQLTDIWSFLFLIWNSITVQGTLWLLLSSCTVINPILFQLTFSLPVCCFWIRNTVMYNIVRKLCWPQMALVVLRSDLKKNGSLLSWMAIHMVHP